MKIWLLVIWVELVLLMLYDEISMVDWNNVDFTESTGHFTQLVWRSTTQVGCAKMMCSTAWRQITVCEYLPRGNVIGLNVTSGYLLC